MSNKTLHQRLAADPRWKPARAYVLDRDEGICWICRGDDADSADHIIPISHMTPEQWDQGLPWNVDNMKAAHKECNGRRGNRIEARQPWHNTRWLDSIR